MTTLWAAKDDYPLPGPRIGIGRQQTKTSRGRVTGRVALRGGRRDYANGTTTVADVAKTAIIHVHVGYKLDRYWGKLVTYLGIDFESWNAS